MSSWTEKAYKIRSQALDKRLNALHGNLLNVYDGGKDLSSSSKGTEREIITKQLLEMTFTSPLRFGTGDIIDMSGHESGQVDIVLENQRAMSFPLVSATSPRLYLAENVAAAIEVKSSLPQQWAEAVEKARKVSELKPASEKRYWEEAKRLADTGVGGWDNKWASTVIDNQMKATQPAPKIPLFVIGFNGWAQAETLARHLLEVEGAVLGILTFRPELRFAVTPDQGSSAKVLNGNFGLLAFLSHIQSAFDVLPPLTMGTVNWYIDEGLDALGSDRGSTSRHD